MKKFQGIRDRVRTFAGDMLKRRGAPSSTISQALTRTMPVMRSGRGCQFRNLATMLWATISVSLVWILMIEETTLVHSTVTTAA